MGQPGRVGGARRFESGGLDLDACFAIAVDVHQQDAQLVTGAGRVGIDAVEAGQFVSEELVAHAPAPQIEGPVLALGQAAVPKEKRAVPAFLRRGEEVPLGGERYAGTHHFSDPDAGPEPGHQVRGIAVFDHLHVPFGDTDFDLICTVGLVGLDPVSEPLHGGTDGARAGKNVGLGGQGVLHRVGVKRDEVDVLAGDA